MTHFHRPTFARITLVDGAVVVVNLDHVINVETRGDRTYMKLTSGSLIVRGTAEEFWELLRQFGGA